MLLPRRRWPLLLVVLSILLLLCTPLSVRGDDFSSTGDESSSTGEEDSSTGEDSSSSSSTGPAAPIYNCDELGSMILPGSPDPVFVCGCIQTINETRFDPVLGENVTAAVNTYTYPSGKRWDRNARDTATPWDTSIEADNSPSNYVDTLNNGLFVLINSSYVMERRAYPQCYGGVPGYDPLVPGIKPPLGMTSNCLQQYDVGANKGKQTDFSGRFFCEGSETPDAKFIKGDISPPICLVYGGGQRLHKMRFYPKVDQFALLTIQNSFNSTTGYAQLGHLGTTFQVELQGKQSEYRHRYGVVNDFNCVENELKPGEPCEYKNTATCAVVPFHTIVIKMDSGKISEISWDDDDSLCDNDHSVDGNCAIPVSECVSSESYGTENTAAATDCDFKIYVSWQGTDADGTFLSSSQRRLSQFRQWSLSSVYNEASKFDVNSLPTIPTEQE